MRDIVSWGRYPFLPQLQHQIYWPKELHSYYSVLNKSKSTILPYGLGRSYGDSCLADSNNVISINSMNRILHVDWNKGALIAQAGITFSEIISFILPYGWFLPVSPGTKFITLGGAVANDVHGKNHHNSGTFGSFIKRIILYNSQKGIIECSSNNNSNLFAATIGGLGLTGLILEVEFSLKKVSSSYISQSSYRFDNLDEYFEISKARDHNNEYAVAWIDCTAKGKSFGRGQYITGNHDENKSFDEIKLDMLSIPFKSNFSLVNKFTLKVFNELYFQKQQRKEVLKVLNLDKFFYPLDKIRNWNLMYGKNGFQQYQCVLPKYCQFDLLKEILNIIAKSETGSFLAVLKNCGPKISPGMLSFPMEGVSLALDFPQKKLINKRLFLILDHLVHEAGGRLYPAKDAHMSAIHFKRAYPRWAEVEKLRDPRILSKFWMRTALG